MVPGTWGSGRNYRPAGRRASAIIFAEAPHTIPEFRSCRFRLPLFFPRMWPRLALRCLAFLPEPVSLNRFAIPLCVLTFVISTFRQHGPSKNRSGHISERDGQISTLVGRNSGRICIHPLLGCPLVPSVPVLPASLPTRHRTGHLPCRLFHRRQPIPAPLRQGQAFGKSHSILKAISSCDNDGPFSANMTREKLARLPANLWNVAFASETGAFGCHANPTLKNSP